MQAYNFNSNSRFSQAKKYKNQKIRRWVGYNYEAIVVDGVDVLLLGDHVAEAATSRVLEGDAIGLGAQDPVDVVAIVELVVKAFGDFDGLVGITILNDDEVVLLKEWPPHLEEVEVSDRGDHDVELILQQRNGFGRRVSHWRGKVREGRKMERVSSFQRRKCESVSNCVRCVG